MAEFSRLIITEKGKALIAKMLAGSQAVVFTKISSSDTAYQFEELELLTGLSNIKQTNAISKITVINENTVKVETSLSNTELTEGYYIKTLGLYAQDPDEGEILYAAAVETSGNCYMPAYKGITVSGAYIQLVTTVGNAENISLEISDSAQATISDIKDLQEQVDGVSGIIENVSAQVKVNTAKIEKLTDFGTCVYKEDFCIEYDGVPTNDHSYTTVHTFDDFTADLDPNGRYRVEITTDAGLAQYIYIDGENTIASDLQGCIWCSLTRSGYPLACKNAPIFPYTDNSISIDLDMRTFATNPLTLSGIDLRFRPYFFEADEYGKLQDVSKTLNICMNMELRVYKVSYDFSSISGGGELPDVNGGTSDYKELENKPTINGVVLEGDLTAEDLGLEGSSGTTNYENLENKPTINGVELTGNLTSEQLGLSGGGASSLTDLGVEATAEELNYMTNVTSDVQEQLNSKAASEHTHSEYAATETVSDIDSRVTALETAQTTFVFTDTAPTEVAKNTIVMVYETE